MNRLSAVALATGCLTSLSACQSPTVYFELEAKGSSTIQGSPLGGLLGQLPQATGLTNLQVSDSQEFKNQGVRKEDVRSVKVKRITLRITSPDDADFSWLSSLRLFAETSGRRDRIAQKEGISALGLKPPRPQFDLDLDDVELKPYVIAPSMSVTSEASGRMPANDVTIEAVVRLGIDANVVR